MSRPPVADDRQRGFALIAVLLVLAFVSIIGAEFAYSMRLEASAARAFEQTLVAGHLAEAGLEQATREIVAANYNSVAVSVGLGDEKSAEADPDCPLVFYAPDHTALKRLPHKNVPLGSGQFSYCITDEEARLNLNVAQPAVLDRLLQGLGVEKENRDIINDSLLDWKDPNEEHRLNGAESEDYYLKLTVPYRSKNGLLDTVGELMQVRGFSRQLMEGADGHPGLASLVTVKTANTININTASHEVLRALGVSDAKFSEIEQTRRLGPYTSNPNVPALGGISVGFTSRTFRIEAQGIIDGKVRARLSAVVQFKVDAGGTTVAVLEWSGIH
jgi:general secretion pathway protein K